MSETDTATSLATLCATGDVAPLHEAIAELEGDVLHLDASSLDSLTSPALHITLSAMKSCAELDKRLEVIGASDVLLGEFAQVGVDLAELMQEASQ